MTNTLLQNLINGALTGCIYALIALGLSLIFGVMNVVNFAHGDFVMLSMYLTFWIGLWAEADAVFTPLLTFPALFLIGLLAYYALIDRTLRQRYVTQIAVTVGLMTFLRALAQLIWKAQPRALPYSLIQGSIQIGPYTILASRLVSAAVSVLAILGVYLFLYLLFILVLWLRPRGLFGRK